MNAEEKRRVANEKRLRAVKQWNKNRTVQNVSHGIHVKYDDGDGYSSEKKPKLFESESDDEQDDYFSTKPQFEGQNGLNLLEMSSQFSSRFKLDERFKEDEEPTEVIDKNEEKTKNIKILESVLGHQVSESTSASKYFTRKKQIRFDPDDESASKYLKVSENSDVKTKTSEKKEKKSEAAPEEIPISSERYIEVSSNLKDILSSSSGAFSLTDKFGSDKDLKDEMESDISSAFLSKEAEKKSVKTSRDFNDKNGFSQNSKLKKFEPRVKKDPFFITEDDFRLKEGVDFFIRPKPLEIIREEWTERRDSALELFKKRRRPGQRNTSNPFHSTKRRGSFKRNAK